MREEDRYEYEERAAIMEYCGGLTKRDAELKAKRLIKKKNPLSEFETFWSIYPKKVGKGAAEKAWIKIQVPNVLVLIENALKWQRTSRDWVKGYIPHPTTYLNQTRWLDQPPPVAKQIPDAREVMKGRAPDDWDRRYEEKYGTKN